MRNDKARYQSESK